MLELVKANHELASISNFASALAFELRCGLPPEDLGPVPPRYLAAIFASPLFVGHPQMAYPNFQVLRPNQNTVIFSTHRPHGIVEIIEEALDLIRAAEWVHFACHGMQDDVDGDLYHQWTPFETVLHPSCCHVHVVGLLYSLRVRRQWVTSISPTRPSMSQQEHYLQVTDEPQAVVGAMWSISDRHLGYLLFMPGSTWECRWSRAARPSKHGGSTPTSEW
ncbi:hypothetical protein L210DRAFT_3565860 [Boletus edulis BED1]|uniref:CHAT domain-containing protein n=1 Tax=Boletus edulis BED1 TaxID=1328754 RepID=A0AAD4BFR9_BOLED|nr:hypothetical protein L210DRAFT_3565816 [Boletus edulis BED1]KAF8426808.1 hypothetical protein L210DRAFT_3565860 [Boletus edulis BED1]